MGFSCGTTVPFFTDRIEGRTGVPAVVLKPAVNEGGGANRNADRAFLIAFSEDHHEPTILAHADVP
jgi:hypothetical protein